MTNPNDYTKHRRAAAQRMRDDLREPLVPEVSLAPVLIVLGIALATFLVMVAWLAASS